MSSLNLLPEDVIGRIIGYIHPDELRPLASVNRAWFKRKLPLNRKITHYSLTSPDLLDYYRIRMITPHVIRCIIEAGGNYDFYMHINGIPSRIINQINPRIMLDDSRYITESHIDGILRKEVAMKIHPNMIGHGKPIELRQLEDYGLYMDSIDRKEYACTLNRYDVLRCCAKYDNIRIMPMMLYDKCDCIHHMIKLGAIQCLKYIMDNFPNDHYTKSSSVHTNVIEYVVDNWSIMEDYVGIEALLASDGITPELISRIDMSLYEERSIKWCNPCIALMEEVRPLLEKGVIYYMYLDGSLTQTKPIKLKSYHILRDDMNKLVNILTHPNKFLLPISTLPKLLTYALPTLDNYIHNTELFMAKYDKLKDQKWSGNISNPNLYKRLVVKHWRYYYIYTGPLDDSMCTLKFKKTIGDPLFGRWHIDKLPVKLKRPLTGHEKKSIIENERLDIVYKYGLSSLNFRYANYYYRKCHSKKLVSYLVNTLSTAVPPFCINKNARKDLTEEVNLNIKQTFPGDKIILNMDTDMCTTDLLEAVNLKAIKISTSKLYECLMDNPMDILDYGVNLYNHVKHMIDPQLRDAINQVLKDRSIQVYE